MSGIEKPEKLRERLRQEELKNNPVGTFSDGVNRSQFGNFNDLIGGLGWKGTLFLLVLITMGYLIYQLF